MIHVGSREGCLWLTCVRLALVGEAPVVLVTICVNQRAGKLAFVATDQRWQIPDAHFLLGLINAYLYTALIALHVY